MDLDRLLGHRFPEVTHDYTEQDCMLYALSIGLGNDPLDQRQLRYVYERDLAVFPTMAVVLATPGFWVSQPEFNIDFSRVLQGEQELTAHRPLPSSGRVISQFAIDQVFDKGDAGAVIRSRRELSNPTTGELIATLRGTTLCRGDGGFGGEAQSPANPTGRWERPERTPDHIVDQPTSRTAALLYRLTGDRNALHADPTVAGKAGFARPILHGLCTYGHVAHAIVGALGDYEPTSLRSLNGRFSSPVVPGETVRTSIWTTSAGILCEATCDGRVVFTRGTAELR